MTTADQKNAEIIGKLRDNITMLSQQAERQRRREVAATTQAFTPYAFAALPTASATRVGWVAFCTNGRKVGEGAGSGSGVPVYCAQTTPSSGIYAWFRMSDDTQVAV